MGLFLLELLGGDATAPICGAEALAAGGHSTRVRWLHSWAG